MNKNDNAFYTIVVILMVFLPPILLIYLIIKKLNLSTKDVGTLINVSLYLVFAICLLIIAIIVPISIFTLGLKETYETTAFGTIAFFVEAIVGLVAGIIWLIQNKKNDFR